MKRIPPTCAALLLLFACARELPPPPPAPAPNVVLIVANGFGVGAWSLARLTAQAAGERLALDSADSYGFLAADVESEGAGKAGSRTPPLRQSLAEAGRAMGVVTTARVTGDVATLWIGSLDRGESGASLEDERARELIALRPRVMFGGGRRHFLPRDSQGVRQDGRDLLAAAARAGWNVVDALPDSADGRKPLLGLFSDSRYPQELDRGGEPGLEEMTRIALEQLRGAGEPWFLLVEEGCLDAAARDHDAASLAADSGELDRAVATILEHVDRSRTLVVAVGGRARAAPAVLADAHPESLSVVSSSVERLEWRIFGAGFHGTPEELERIALPVLDREARHTGLSFQDLDRLLTSSRRSERKAVLGTILSRRFGIAFLALEDQAREGGEEGVLAELVPVRAWGPRAGELNGIRTHAELGRWLRDVLELPVAEHEPAEAPRAIDTTGTTAVG
jgi:hypothetical protein